MRLSRLFKKKWVLALGAVVIIATLWYSFGASKKAPYSTVKVQRGSLAQEVSVTGKTKPMQSVDLAFEHAGRIVKADVNVGDKVAAGGVLAMFDQSDLVAQVAQAQAALATQQAKLADLEQGTRPEELRIAKTAVSSAQKTLDDAKTNLANVQAKADSDMQAVYADALGAMIKSMNIATNSLMVMTDMQVAHYGGYDQTSVSIATAKAQAVLALLGGSNGGRWTNDIIAAAAGGAKGLALAAQMQQTVDSIDAALPAGRDALLKVKAALDAMPTAPLLTSTETTNLNTEKNNMTSEAVTSVTKQEAITGQKALNQNAIAAAQASVTTASNALDAAKDMLALKQAGATPQEIEAQKAQVAQAQANLQSAQVQLDKATLRAPFAGIVTKQDAKVGEIVGSNIPIVSVISDNGFEIEAFMPEADVAKIKLGDPAKVTLDAYGDAVVFDTTVIALDPAETMVEGVATYKTTFAFAHEDARIKSGMTANIDIMTEKRENVIMIPQRSVGTKNGNSFVLIPQGSGTPVERAVSIGLKGSSGMVEVLSGLSEGEEILDSSAAVTQ